MRGLFIILILGLTAAAATSQCHYSCATCSSKYYTKCLTCSDSSLAVKAGASCGMKADQTILTKVGGLCSRPTYSGVNPLGVILLFAAFSSFFLKSSHTSYFVISFQTLGLLALVQTNYSPSLTFILESFQYLMLFSVSQRHTKPQNCKLMLRSMYRMNDFLGTPDFRQNSLPILPLVIVVTSLLFLLSMLLKYQKKRMRILEQGTWNKILRQIRNFLFLTMQQSMLIIYVAIRFSSLDVGLIIMMVLYSIGLIYLIVDCNTNGQKLLFLSTQYMNLGFAKRLVLPLLVVVAHNYTFFLIILLITANIIDLLFLLRTKKVSFRYALYMGGQLLCVVMVGCFVLADIGSNDEAKSNIMGVIASIVLSLYFFTFLVEILFAIRRKLKGVKIAINTPQTRKARLKEKISVSVSRQQDTISEIYQPDRQTKVTPVQFSGRKGSDQLKLTKHKLHDVKVEDLG